jgi:hypothetical protein
MVPKLMENSASRLSITVSPGVRNGHRDEVNKKKPFQIALERPITFKGGSC